MESAGLEGYLDVEERQRAEIQRENLKRLSERCSSHRGVFASPVA